MKKIRIYCLAILIISYICPVFGIAEELADYKMDEATEKNIIESVKNSSENSIITENESSQTRSEEAYIADNTQQIQELSDETQQENSGQNLRTTIASGMFGTSKWQIDHMGTLHIGSGEFINTKNSSPWLPYKKQINKVVFEGPVKASNNSSHLFSNLDQVTEIENLSHLDTSQVKLMRDMFSNVSSLKSLDLSHFDTTRVNDMAFLFSYMGSLVNIDLSSFDTSQVVYMRSMFYNTKNLTNLDLSSFDTSHVEDMSGMFTGTGVKNLDITYFDTSSTTDMSGMLSSVNLGSIDLTNFNTGQVKNMAAMFAWSKIDNLDVSNFDTSQVRDMSDMFTGSQISRVDLANFNTNSVTNINNMFSGSRFTSLNLANFDTNQLVYMYDMFTGMSELKHINLGKDFQFKDGVVLPSPSNSLPYYGKWQRDYEGTVYTSEELAEQYNGLTMSGNYYWAEKRPTLEVKDSTIYKGEKWNPRDNFISAADEEGNNLSFDPTMTADLVNTDVPGDYEVTYTNGTVSKTIIVTVKDNLETIDAKNSIVYGNEPWQAEDNFISATNREGERIEFDSTMTTDTVDTTIPGTYRITYINGISSKTIEVIVRENLTSIQAINSTIKMGESWQAEDNFQGATDKTGAQMDFKNITVTGDVDTSKVGEYEVTYSYDHLSLKIRVLVEGALEEGNKEINKDKNKSTKENDNVKKNNIIYQKNDNRIFPKTGERPQQLFTVIGLLFLVIVVIVLKLRKRFFTL
ncbi:BspA family leucine-rich repeat surface protein [Enterococcus rotai]|uniref:BspA family leucine-rich repeat surface protein n=1 Tax=Enterococcus rotai TaxID=118060 RepID=UPI0032B43B05